MTKKELLTDLKNNFGGKLEKRVLNYILAEERNNNFEGYNFQDKFFNCVLYYASHGCSTGICSELVYYNQTERWFNRYKKEILNLLQEYIDDGAFKVKESFEGYCFIELDRAKIKLDYNNEIIQKQFDTLEKNTLAWFSFEVVTSNILNYLECMEEI